MTMTPAAKANLSETILLAPAFRTALVVVDALLIGVTVATHTTIDEVLVTGPSAPWTTKRTVEVEAVAAIPAGDDKYTLAERTAELVIVSVDAGLVVACELAVVVSFVELLLVDKVAATTALELVTILEMVAELDCEDDSDESLC